ncbi:MAG: oxygenase MpaB family protein [Proteobacteria bacterium]|nr:oxygenase MpaB family protein [Pseudomonadota bacterium]
MTSAGGSLYAPEDLTWQINRESVLLLAGPRALLMQLAHPLVAAGVAAHSDFQRDPIRRLRRTLDAMLGIIYGTRDEARACAEGVNRVHEGVAGTLARGTAAFPAGTPYRALDPDLLFWVQATLQDSALAAYECFVRPLVHEERARLYEESKRMAPLLRLPRERLPASYDDFRAELDATLAGPVLEITDEARALADAVLHPPVPLLPRSLGDAGSVITVALLPPVLRERYGFTWDRKRQLAWRAARELVRRSLPLLPDVARSMPAARRAARRAGTS